MLGATTPQGVRVPEERASAEHGAMSRSGGRGGEGRKRGERQVSVNDADPEGWLRHEGGGWRRHSIVARVIQGYNSACHILEDTNFPRATLSLFSLSRVWMTGSGIM